MQQSHNYNKCKEWVMIVHNCGTLNVVNIKDPCSFDPRPYGTPSVTKINSAIGRHKVRENVMHARRAVIVTRRAVTLQDVL